MEGLAPMFIWRRDDSKRQLSFIGTGISDYCGIISAEDKKNLFAREFINFISSSASELWDVCLLEDIQSGSPLLTAVAQTPLLNARRGAACPRVCLPDSFEKYMAGLAGLKRERLERSQKKLVRLGMQIERVSGPEDAPRALEIFISLHEKSWRRRGQEGVINTNALKGFYRAVSTELAEAGILRIYLMSIPSGGNKNYIAALYSMFHQGRAYCYLGGFDPQFEKLSAGSLIVMHAIKEAIESGISEFDFLRGAEPHKYTWGASDSFNWNISGHAGGGN